ncbi:MAG: methyltransferase domain-containing protein, partial [Rhizobiales bacterium]|nr:methyltransferase domain-containing protein [Rhizobacter sp.]
MTDALYALAQPRHLDLGCGATPRNPYGKAELYGIDIRAFAAEPAFVFRAANLALEPIPFPDNHFASVSAFDFLEHVPRALPSADGTAMRFPFLDLMSEVWRVLAPAGRFYALTPAYPHREAFQDPTHVNTITLRTHEYFCGERPYGVNYGFVGRFEARRAEWVVSRDAEVAGDFTWQQRLRRLRRRL